MIFLKRTLLVVIALVSIALLLYLTRIPLVTTLLNTQLANKQLQVKCLALQLNNDWHLVVKRLCLQSPVADFKINDMHISWQLATQRKINAINIASLSIKGNGPWFTEYNSGTKNTVDNIAQLKAYLTSVGQMAVPFDIDVGQFTYQPYISAKTAKQLSARERAALQFVGSFAAQQDQLLFSLKSPQHGNIAALQFSNKSHLTKAKPQSAQQPVHFKLTLRAGLAPLQHFIKAHNLSLPPELTTALTALQSQGKLNSIIKYQAGLLSSATQLQDFSLISNNKTPTIERMALSGALSFDSLLDLNSAPQQGNQPPLTLKFNGNNQLVLAYQQQQLLDYLERKTLAPELITLVKDNPFSQLVFQPEGELIYPFIEQQLSLTKLEITASNMPVTPKPLRAVAQLTLTNIKLNIATAKNNPTAKINQPTNSTQNQLSSHVGSSLNAVDFAFHGPLFLRALRDVTPLPLQLTVRGSLQQQATKTQLYLQQGSQFSVDKVRVTLGDGSNKKPHTKIKQVTTQLSGNITFSAAKPDHKSLDITLDLTAATIAKQLQLEPVLKLNALTLNTSLTGSLDDFNLNTDISADSVSLGRLQLQGAIDNAHLSLTAEQLALTQLLTLDVKLPTSIDLIEGTLSYNIQADMIDINTMAQTNFTGDLTLNTVSGEIAGVWLQNLTWQQSFTLLDGAISSRKAHQQNLTIALIDTATPITNLSVSTDINVKQHLQISAVALNAELFGGSVFIPSLQWPLTPKHSVNIQLNSIDLAQVLALDPKQGITVTGQVSGQLPVNFDGANFLIEQGRLYNISEGLIQITNNPAVTELKTNNKQLQLAFDALQNLHYHQLSSDVAMSNDGYMLLETVIKGRNPDLDNDVNLNLNLSYDVIGLLESLSITEHFEKAIIKGIQP
ncbi:Dicarboxylate transport [Colwellia chukchiensis]|uniref:Dicarboxylate transport n=1 Tax=Colwellia chukchiensis TaxID=641665 RepID=A0A1H7SJU0_9GAMM|nr:YdbH domain-containing protein [Colwellia chukchiensis]SEL72910.1 Dicarboxylate transport [Colwellia chukchiensis]